MRPVVKLSVPRPRALSLRRWLLLAEAGLLLAAAAAAISLLSFARLARLAGERGVPNKRPPAPAEIAALRWAIEAAARRAPFRAKCFEKGLAAQWMLRRRGIPSTLFYGAAFGDMRALKAHVWVRAGTIDVVGCENAADFAMIARYPVRMSRPPSMR